MDPAISIENLSSYYKGTILFPLVSLINMVICQIVNPTPATSSSLLPGTRDLPVSVLDLMA